MLALGSMPSSAFGTAGQWRVALAQSLVVCVVNSIVFASISVVVHVISNGIPKAGHTALARLATV